MTYWWVNHNKTSAFETGGGYLWSPKQTANGSRNHYYDNMRRLLPGDRVFSYYGGHLQQIGIVQSVAITADRPAEFDAVDHAWADVGWRVPVYWSALHDPFRPRDYIARLQPHLPNKYSPVDHNTGRGNQCYLSQISNSLAEIIFAIIGVIEHKEVEKNLGIIGQVGIIDEVDNAKEKEVWNDNILNNTEKKETVKARIGQGQFRNNVFAVEPICRVTGVTDPQFLRAGHIKPWRNCNNHERLDGNNGLMLAPNIDHLFDKGYITFAANGDIIISQFAPRGQLKLLGIEVDKSLNIGKFSEAQEVYLDFHRKEVFLG